MTLRIGQLAKVAGVNITTVRFYERCGLIPKADRTATGYRYYSQDVIKRIRFIKNAQGLGFTLREIAELLHVRSSSHAVCGTVRNYIVSKLSFIDNKIKDLEKVKKNLEQLHEHYCGPESSSECAILEMLENEWLNTF